MSDYENLFFEGEPDKDIIYSKKETDKNLEHDWLVVSSRFLAERHNQKQTLMAKKIKQKYPYVKYGQTSQGQPVNCERINYYDLDVDENYEILTKSESLAYKTVKDEVETLAKCGHQKALAFYLQHVQPHDQNPMLRAAAEEIAKKHIKNAEEWEISGSLKFFESVFEDFDEFDALSMRNICDMIDIHWVFSSYFASSDEYQEQYSKCMRKYDDLSHQLVNYPAYKDFVMANLAYYGRNVNSNFKSIADLDECLLAIVDNGYNFFDKKLVEETYKGKVTIPQNTQKQNPNREENPFTPTFLKQSMKDALDSSKNVRSLDGNAKIRVKDISAYMMEKMKESDERFRDKVAQARYLALYHSDELKPKEKGFEELGTLGNRIFKSEQMKQFNKVSKFLEEIQNALDTGESSVLSEKEKVKN